MPFPHFTASFVGYLEIFGGLLLLTGLMTRLIAIPFIAEMIVAILSTKIPILPGYGFWGFSLPKLPRYGFWSMMHEARTDFSMWLGLLFLLIVGAGKKWSLDARLAGGNRSSDAPR